MVLKNLKLSLLKKKSSGSSVKSSEKPQSPTLDKTEVTLPEGEDVSENTWSTYASWCRAVAEEDEDEFDNYAHLTQQPEDASKYGYGDEPTEKAEDKYDHYANLTKEPDDASKYGYGDEPTEKVEKKYDHYAIIAKVPDDASKYGYGDEPSTTEEPKRHSWTPPTRRVTMNHYTKTPRRSSMKGSCPVPPISRKRLSLTFNTHVEVTPITPVQELITKKKSMSKLFYKDEEYEQMKDEIYFIADLALEGREEGHCTRGLESVIEADTTDRKHESWDAVLDEQFKQWDAGMDSYDDEAFAKAVKRYSNDSKSEASARALQDAEEVAEYLAETRRFCRGMSI